MTLLFVIAYSFTILEKKFKIRIRNPKRKIPIPINEKLNCVGCPLTVISLVWIIKKIAEIPIRIINPKKSLT